MAQAIAPAFHLDDLGVVEKAIQDGRGGRNIVEEFPAFFDGPIGGHQGGTVFIAAHDDLQEHFPGFGREDFESHVVDLQEVGLGPAVGHQHGCVINIGEEPIWRAAATPVSGIGFYSDHHRQAGNYKGKDKGWKSDQISSASNRMSVSLATLTRT